MWLRALISYFLALFPYSLAGEGLPEGEAVRGNRGARAEREVDAHSLRDEAGAVRCRRRWWEDGGRVRLSELAVEMVLILLASNTSYGY